jgi:hypothetical protein
LIDLEIVTKKIISIVQEATGIKVKAGWLTQEDTFPIITVYSLGQRPEAILMPNVGIYRFTYQIDVWHNSMVECDRAAREIINKFVDAYKIENWFGLNFSINDLQEEGVFRKAIRVDFGAVG